VGSLTSVAKLDSNSPLRPNQMTLTNVTRRSPADLLLATEAFLLLALFRVCLTIVPVRRIIRTITHGPTTAPIPETTPTEPTLNQALRIRWAVEAATRNSAAKFVCFPQTLAGYTMLRLRRVPSTMVYGVARSPEGDLIAHTWLTVGDRIVLGGEGSAAFTPIERWT
jgi:Transglutaminase-like superfamily